MAGSPPAICTEIGPGSPAWSRRNRLLRDSRNSGLEESISEGASAAPKRRASFLNGRSVMPAIGATSSPLRRLCAPILIAAAGRCTNENEGSEFYPLLRGKRINSPELLLSRQRGRAVDHAPRKKTPRPRQDVEQGERSAACGAREAAGAEESAGQKIGDARGCGCIETAACRVALERGGIAGVLRGAQDLRQLPGIAQAEVESLPRDRMQCLRRVADVDRSLGYASGSHPPGERPDGSLPHFHRCGQAAHRQGELGEKRSGRHFREPACTSRARAPYKCIASRMGKQGKRAFRREAFVSRGCCRRCESHDAQQCVV